MISNIHLMKHYAYILLLAIVLVGCEKNAQEAENTQYKDFSVATYMYYYDSFYDSLGGHWDGNTTQTTTADIIFADDYRCMTTYFFADWTEGSRSARRDTNYYYYELDYPYISLYNVADFFRWDIDSTQDKIVIRADTKEELQTRITGKAGVLKFATDTTVLYTVETFSTMPFFSINVEFNIEPNWRVENPEKYFPVPQL